MDLNGSSFTAESVFLHLSTRWRFFSAKNRGVSVFSSNFDPIKREAHCTISLLQIYSLSPFSRVTKIHLYHMKQSASFVEAGTEWRRQKRKLHCLLLIMFCVFTPQRCVWSRSFIHHTTALFSDELLVSTFLRNINSGSLTLFSRDSW